MRLERDLDTRLFARSTRSLRLTNEGERYLPYAKDMIALLHSGRDELRRGDDALSGTLQIAAPSDFGRNVLLNALPPLAYLQTAVGAMTNPQIARQFAQPHPRHERAVTQAHGSRR